MKAFLIAILVFGLTAFAMAADLNTFRDGITT